MKILSPSQVVTRTGRGRSTFHSYILKGIVISARIARQSAAQITDLVRILIERRGAPV